LTVLPPILIFFAVASSTARCHAVLVVLAEVGDAAGQRACVADLDGHDFFGGSCGRLRRCRPSSVLPYRNQ
jgi:hypothetical protein